MKSIDEKNVNQETQDWYEEYYEEKGQDRNDLLTNPEVLFQHLAFEVAIVNALRKATGLGRTSSKILDVGCGSGSSMTQLIQLGYSSTCMHGIDIVSDRIDEALQKYPNIDFVVGDATSMPYATGEFDLVMESTMFVQLTDEDLSQRIAREMLRVVKPGGYLLLIDWRYGKPGNKHYAALTPKRVARLFAEGTQTDVVCREKGALVPPLGRALSRYLPSMYFLLRGMFPFLVASQATLLRKRAD